MKWGEARMRKAEGGEFVQTLWRPEPADAPTDETGQVTGQVGSATEEEFSTEVESSRGSGRLLPSQGRVLTRFGNTAPDPGKSPPGAREDRSRPGTAGERRRFGPPRAS